MTAPSGDPTNALFGFIRQIQALEAAWMPRRMAVVFDGGRPKSSLDILPEYKANRAAMPAELRVQLPLLSEYLDWAGIPALRVEGEEADDLIASYARAAAAEGVEVIIATNDKDILQLTCDRIRIYSTAKPDAGADGFCLLGVPEVQAKWGVLPSQIADVLALTGDSSDNIPGVEGLGPKTAAKLLGQFGTLGAMWGRIAELESDRLREKLLANRERVERNRELVRLRDDLDCRPDWNAMALKPEDTEKLRSFYERMEFHSLAQQAEQLELF